MWEEADCIRIDVSIDAGSLTCSEVFSKAELKLSRKVRLKRFEYLDMGRSFKSWVKFEKRSNSMCFSKSPLDSNSSHYR
jgi:hypothetical protein